MRHRSFVPNTLISPWMVMAPSGGASAYRDIERSMCEWTPVSSVCIMLLYSC